MLQFDIWNIAMYHFLPQVTSLASMRSEAQTLVCLPVSGAPGECYYNTVLYSDYFWSSSVVSRVFSALCLYTTFGHHPRP